MNHDEFDEIRIMFSWLISIKMNTRICFQKIQTNDIQLFFIIDQLFSSNIFNHNIRTWMRSGSCECSQSSINASGTWFGISYGLDKTIAQRPRTPNYDQHHVIWKEFIDIVLYSKLTSMSFNDVFRWCYFLSVNFRKITYLTHRTKIFLHKWQIANSYIMKKIDYLRDHRYWFRWSHIDKIQIK